jgi:hypothetical protein
LGQVFFSEKIKKRKNGSKKKIKKKIQLNNENKVEKG